MTGMNPKVDWFFNKATSWQEAYTALRMIALDCGLTEELKWGVPCYTFQKSNILLIHGFKKYCALLFHKGALLKDENNLLTQQTANVQAARQLRFKNLAEIVEKAPILKAYIYEAIEVEKSGLNVVFKKTAEYNIPEEFQKRLNENKSLKIAFERLTPGRQRAYMLYFSQPKQSKTRELRIEKYSGKILNGQGLDD
jgi:uncharacterized protein YdeI (YjbR/CyaY-like superfamily)